MNTHDKNRHVSLVCFKQIYSYMKGMKDEQAMLGKFKFLQILLDYEHYIPLNLPLPPVLTSLDASQLIRDFWYANCTPSSFFSSPLSLPPPFSLLSEKPYRHKHFLAGLLLRELDLESAQEKSKAMRTQAVITLRNLLKKHDTDERYVMVGAKQRIADLYFPYLLLVSGRSHVMILSSSPHVLPMHTADG